MSATPGAAGPGTPGPAGSGPAGSGPGSSGSAGPATPGSAGPATPGSAGPATPGSAGPATPGSAGPATPGSPGPATPGSAGPATPGPGPAGPGTAHAAAAPEGWLTDAQAERLGVRAAAAGAGTIVEIGSFRGRSTVVIARAAAAGARVVAIDPHAGSDRGPQEIGADAIRGNADHDAFTANLAAAGVSDRVRHVRKMSADALGDVDGPLAMLYVDGAHRFAPARDDIARWGARVAPGGVMLVHDSYSSIGVTGALLVETVAGGAWRYAGRAGSLAEYEKLAAPLSGTARARNAARQLAQLPWFARNVLFKALVLAGLRPLAHRLGLPAGMHWPY